MADRVVRATKHEPLVPAHPDHTVKVALVSLPQIEYALAGYRALEPRWHCRGHRSRFGLDEGAVERTVIRQKAKQRQWFTQAYVGALNYCVDELEADIIVFNELAIPTFDGAPLRSIHKALLAATARHPCYVIAGTAHDHRTMMNTGYAYCGGYQDGFVQFHKNVSAIAVSERISVPARKQILSARVCGLNIAALVCLDLADHAVVTAAVTASDLMDVVFVACYTEIIEPLEAVARVVSDAIGSQTVMINRQRSADRPAYAYFDRGQRRTLTPPTPVGQALVYFFTIDGDDLGSQKAQWTLDRDPDDPVGWLFGSPVQRR